MKKITVNELANIMAGKLDLDVQVDNFEDFKTFLEDIYTQFVTDWPTLDDQAYRHHQVNYPERIVEIPTKVLLAVYEEANKLFALEGEDNFCDVVNNTYGDTPHSIEGPVAIINYADEVDTSMQEFLLYWKDVCKRFDCEIQVLAGTIDDGEYGNHMLKWQINGEDIKSVDCFFDIPDDNGIELMDALYWLCVNFFYDTFESFDKLGVELRYYNKDVE